MIAAILLNEALAAWREPFSDPWPTTLALSVVVALAVAGLARGSRKLD